MTTYVDSSVFLRMALREPGPSVDRDSRGDVLTSALTEVECLRTIDRLLVGNALSTEEAEECRATILGLLDGSNVVELSRGVLRRAAESLPVPLGTADALHLSTALMWRDNNHPLSFATHDTSLALAARAEGFQVLGL